MFLHQNPLPIRRINSASSDPASPNAQVRPTRPCLYPPNRLSPAVKL
ncbi:hypothetical protein BVG79_00635 [Ketogulonicigenium robustum]|uniref:Uncharacterized protein n=1 Tax=Ketogulonicigenium robustum TaxID=92947 RepID=A0A1W6NY85_9RHOB|nr:hypothetical protein BVG79_00635 [Ketogulonicigenium robustum]